MTFGGIALGLPFSHRSPCTLPIYVRHSSYFDQSEDSERRPPNAFILFSRSARPSIQAEYPGLSNVEYTRIFAKMWKALPESEKMLFKGLAADMQDRFKLRNPNYAYQKTAKGPTVRVVPREDNVFRWDQMLNHHDDDRSGKD
jgi:hypothetical protein